MSDRPTTRPVFTTDEFDAPKWNDKVALSDSSDEEEDIHVIPGVVFTNEPKTPTPDRGGQNPNISSSSQHSFLSTASSKSMVAKRPASTIKESLNKKKSSNSSKGDIKLAANSKIDQYYESKSEIANKKYQIQEEGLKAESRQKFALSNLEVLRCRKEARELDPSLTEDQLNALFPFK